MTKTWNRPNCICQLCQYVRISITYNLSAKSYHIVHRNVYVCPFNVKNYWSFKVSLGQCNDTVGVSTCYFQLAYTSSLYQQAIAYSFIEQNSENTSNWLCIYPFKIIQLQFLFYVQLVVFIIIFKYNCSVN